MPQAPKKAQPLKQSVAQRANLIQAVQSPLGFFVLTVLIVEVIMGGLASFSPADRITFAYLMAGLITLLVLLVAGLAVFDRTALLGQPKVASTSPRQIIPATDQYKASHSSIVIPEGQSNATIRCSFSALVRIEVNDLYLLVKGRRIKHQFQPVGGVYKRHLPSREALQRFGVQDDSKMPIDSESIGDLRVLVPAKKPREFLRLV